MNIRQLLAPPTFEDEAKTRTAAFLLPITLILLAALATAVLLITVFVLQDFVLQTAFGLFVCLVLLVTYTLTRLGHVRLASYLLIHAIWGAVTVGAFLLGGVRIPATTLYLIITLIAGLVFERRGSIIVAGICALSIVGLFLAETLGYIQYPAATPIPLAAVTLIHLVMLVSATSLIQLYAHQVDRAMENTKRSEERYRTLAETAQDVIFMIDVGGTIRYVNQAGAQLLGTTPKDAIGKPLDALFPTQVADKQATALQHIIQSGQLGTYENRFEFPTGTIWLNTVLVPIEENDQVTSVLGISRDVTERVQSEETQAQAKKVLQQMMDKVQRAKQEWEEIFQAIGQPTIILDPHHGIIAANRAVLELTGKQEQDLVGEKCYEIFHQADGAPAEPPQGCPLERMLDSARLETVEMEIEALGGTFLVSCTPILDEQGQPERIIHIATDVTEIKQLEAQMRQQEKMAAIGKLAGGIAHDFNNLMTSIILYAQMLLHDENLSSDLEPQVGVILNEARQAARLVQQILDFGRRAMIETRPVNLTHLLEETVNMLQRTLPENILLTLSTDDTDLAAPYIAQVDPARIQQAVINLATNARDAMPKGGMLELGISSLETSPAATSPLEGASADLPAGTWIRLSVSDTGTGMTEEVQSHLFEPFFTTKPVGKGTGLGLAQVYGIVTQHGGSIDYETAEAKGTTFYIYLPAHEVEHILVEETETQTPPRGKQETILLVEDQAMMRQAAAQVLTSLGYRVLEAADGQKALAICQSQPIDLVLTDLVMPEMGGKALTEQLGLTHPQIKVVAITGYAIDQIQELEAAGIQAVIQKPFTVLSLARAIREALDSETVP